MIDVKDVAFFVTGQGRSGTQWVAKILDKTRSDVTVLHEACGRQDAKWYGRVYCNPSLGPEWMWYRQRWMNPERLRGKRWGEVNSYLRYAAHDLRTYFQAPVAAVIRNGKDVVRSMQRRSIYAKRSPPVPTPSYAETPFLKCCWYWADAYRLLIAWKVPIFRLEDLTEDYGALHALCHVLEVETPPEGAWQRLKDQRVNASKGGRITEWTPEMHEAFRRIAGDVQKTFYPDDYTYGVAGVEVVDG